MNLEEQLTAEQFYNNFVADDRFVKYILGGLKTTLLVTLFAVLLGIFLGFLVGTVRSTYERTGTVSYTHLDVYKRQEKACSNILVNHTLEEVLYENMKAVGLPEYTEEEYAFASAI